MNTQYHERNISMVMDMYELTMSNGYLNQGFKDTWVAFDVFYRNNPDNGGFAIFAGLQQVVEYIEKRMWSICGQNGFLQRSSLSICCISGFVGISMR